MAINVIQDINGISVNNVPGAVKADITGGYPIAEDTEEVFYSDAPENEPVFIDTGLVDIDKWSGSALAPNEKIYFCPWSHPSVGIYNPFDKTFDDTSIPISGTLNGNWYGFVLAKNEKLYGIPLSSDEVLVVDTKTNKHYFIPGVTGGSSKFSGGCLDPLTGKIYCAPRDSTYVLIIDPSNDTIDTTTITGISGAEKFRGICASHNGKLYCVPYDSEYVLIIDTSNNTVDTTTIAGLVGNSKWIGGAYAQNGKIYCAPFQSTSSLIIDTNNDTSDIASITGLTQQYVGACIAPSNKIYFGALSATNFAIVDPNTDTVDTTTIIVPAGSGKWDGLCLDNMGNIVGTPLNDSNIISISTGNPSINIDWCLSAYRNKL